jgi:hypothetical protein
MVTWCGLIGKALPDLERRNPMTLIGFAGLFTGSVLEHLAFSAILPAYIDPNSGGMLFQVLAVLFGVISGLFLFFSGKIKSAFYNLRRRIVRSDSEEIRLDHKSHPAKNTQEQS